MEYFQGISFRKIFSFLTAGGLIFPMLFMAQTTHTAEGLIPLEASTSGAVPSSDTGSGLEPSGTKSGTIPNMGARVSGAAELFRAPVTPSRRTGAVGPVGKPAALGLGNSAEPANTSLGAP